IHHRARVLFELAAAVLQRKLVPGAAQELSREAVLRGVLPLSRLADPAAELVRVEMGISAVDHRCECAVPEGEKRAIRALGGTGAIPRPRGSAHAAYFAAPQQPHDVDVGCGLVEHDAT